MIIALVVLSFAVSLLSHTLTASAATGINHQINFQGKLVNTNGTNVTDGNYSIVFSLYTVSSGGSNIWTETQPTVAVSNGIFQVNLGSVTALPGSVDFNTDNIYLGVKVGADAEMTPRIQFTSVPQAFNAEKLGGLDKTGYIQNTVSQQASSNFNISGAGVIGTTLTTPTVQSAAATALTITGNAASTWSTSAGNITLQAGGGTVTLGSTTSLTSSGALSITGGTTLTLDSTTTSAVNIGTSANAKTITIGNVTGATQIVLNNGTGGVLVNTLANSQLKITSNALIPTIDQVLIDNTGSTGVATAGVSGLQINYKGGAAAVESSAERIDLQPGATTGGTWNGARVVQNVTGPATGVTTNGAKYEGPATTGGAGTYNAINIANIGTVASGGTVRGVNITGTNSQAAGTIRGIQLNNLTGGAASEIGIDLGTGWDSLLTYNNGGTVIINGTGMVQTAAGGTNLNTSASTGVPSISAGTWSVAATLAATLGGTGTGTYAVGDLLTGDAGNTLAKITAVASGSCLISQGVTTKPIWGSCSGLTATNGLNITTNQVGLGGTLANSATSITSGGVNSQISLTSGANIPAVDQLVVDNTGSTGVTAAGVSGLQINYKGGAAAVESSGQRIDLTPGGTTGGTWNALRVVQNVTGPATGVTSNGAKFEGPATTGGAGTYNAINIANIGTVASGGIVRGVNITGTNSQAAGTIRGIQLNNLTAGAASEIGIDLGTGWDSLLTYNNNAKVIINGTGFVQTAAGGTNLDTSGSTGVPSIAAGTWSVAATLAATLGGTGQSSYAVGDLLYAPTTTTVGKLAAVASGSCLISQGTNTAPVWGSCTTLTANNGLTITTNVVGLGGSLNNSTTTLTGSASSQILLTSSTNVPAANQFVIDNTSSTGVTSSDVNGLRIAYKGGAANVEAAAQRIELSPGGTSGSTWSAIRVEQNSTGPATGVTSNALKLNGPGTTGGAGTYNAINIPAIGVVGSGGTVRGINLTGTNSQAAGTVRGIQLNNLTAGAASEIGIDLGTGWDSLLTYNNGGTVIINGTGMLQTAAGGTNLNTSASTGVPSISAGTWSVAATLAATLGGTGQSSYAVGDILTGDAGNTLAKIAAVATGSCLISQGVTTKPIWGACAGLSLGTYSTSNTAAQGATLASGVLTFQDASASAPGMVGTGTQTFIGSKTFTTAATAGGIATLAVTPGAHTGVTVEVNNFKVNGNTQTITGAIATQRFNLFGQSTITAASALAVTDAATVAIVGAPIKSGSATIASSSALLIQAGAVGAATASYGLNVNAQTGATNNYAAIFQGGAVGIGTTAPTATASLVIQATATQNTNGYDLLDLKNSSGTTKMHVDAYGNIYAPETLIGTSTWYNSSESVTAYGDTIKGLVVSSFSGSASANVLEVINAGSGASLRVNDDGTTTDSTPFLVDSSGNTGIGIVSPTAKLHVVGAINTSTVPASWVQNAIFDNAATSSQNITEFRVAGTKRASLRVDSSGNAIVNPSGTGATYLSWDEGSGGVIFGNGANGNVGSVTSAGAANFLSNVGNLGSQIGQVLEPGTAGGVATYRFDNDAWRLYAGGTGGGGELLRVTEGGYVGIGAAAASPSSMLDIEGTLTVTSGTSFLNSTTLTVSPASAPGAVTVYIASDVLGTTSSANVNSNTYIYGTRSRAISAGTTAMQRLMGIAVSAEKTGTGNVADAFALYGRVDNANATGTLTNAYAAYLATALQTGTITNNWGLYQVDNAAKNYFAGNVGVNTTAAGSPLTVRSATAGSCVIQLLDTAAGQNLGCLYESSGGGALVLRNAADTAYNVGLYAEANGYMLNNLAIGQASVNNTYKLYVEDNVASNWIMRINNSSTANTADGLLINLGVANASRTTGNDFISFAGAGVVDGTIQGGAGAVAYATSGADYAEYYNIDPNNKPAPGEIVRLNSANGRGVVRANASNPGVLVGIVSTSPGFIGNGPSCPVESVEACKGNHDNYNALVGMVGQVDVKVNTSNGAINVGDPITASSVDGVGAKAIGAGPIVGYAQESLASGTGTIQVLIRTEFYDPSDGNHLQAQSVMTDTLQVGSANIANLNVSGAATINDLTVTGSATFEGDLTVAGTVNVVNIVVGGHIITAGDAPIVAALTAAGNNAAVTVTGNDTSGTINFTSGANPTAGDLVNITFAKTYGKTPHIVLTPNDGVSAPLLIYPTSQTATGFKFALSNLPAANTSYSFTYFIVE